MSIVTATYGRSRALAATVESIRRQTVEDWELIVVGDATPDDSGDVVASFDDPRIRFVNLLVNTGEQAGPNNVGIGLSRAPVVAFCNHDVIWLPEHLRLGLETMATQQADLVFGVEASIDPRAPRPLRWPTAYLALFGMTADGHWHPDPGPAATVPASVQLARRSMLEALHGYRPARELRSEPSQDLMFRAWRAGFRLRGTNQVSAATAPAGFTEGSYVGNQADDQEWLLSQLGRDDLGAELAAMVLETNPTFAARSRSRHPGIVRLLSGTAARLGVDPRAFAYRWQQGLLAGDYLRGLRRIRGLAALEAPTGAGPALRFAHVRRSCAIGMGATVQFGAGEGGARYLASGWSRPAEHGVWSDGDRADLLLDLGRAPERALTIDLEAHPFLPRPDSTQEVEVLIGDEPVERWTMGHGDHHRQVTVAARLVPTRHLRLGLRFGHPSSPLEAGQSTDARQLAIELRSLRLTMPDASDHGTPSG